MQVNVQLSDDVKEALLRSKAKEESPIGKQILNQLEENMDINTVVISGMGYLSIMSILRNIKYLKSK